MWVQPFSRWLQIHGVDIVLKGDRLLINRVTHKQASQPRGVRGLEKSKREGGVDTAPGAAVTWCGLGGWPCCQGALLREEDSKWVKLQILVKLVLLMK